MYAGSPPPPPHSMLGNFLSNSLPLNHQTSLPTLNAGDRGGKAFVPTGQGWYDIYSLYSQYAFFWMAPVSQRYGLPANLLIGTKLLAIVLVPALHMHMRTHTQHAPHTCTHTDNMHEQIQAPPYTHTYTHLHIHLHTQKRAYTQPWNHIRM